jgi:hypothetical protein
VPLGASAPQLAGDLVKARARAGAGDGFEKLIG